MKDPPDNWLETRQSSQSLCCYKVLANPQQQRQAAVQFNVEQLTQETISRKFIVAFFITLLIGDGGRRKVLLLLWC